MAKDLSEIEFPVGFERNGLDTLGWGRKPGDSEIEVTGEADHRPPYFQAGN